MTRAKRHRRRQMSRDRAAIQAARPDDWSRPDVGSEARDAETHKPGPCWPTTSTANPQGDAT